MNRWIWRAARVCAALCWLLPTAFADVAPRVDGIATLPRPTGLHPVTRATFEWTDTTRTEPSAHEATAKRKLRVLAWYPARADGDLVPGSEKFPVLIMGPGLGFQPTDYSALAGDLASHGYVVLGVATSDGRRRQVEELVGLRVADERFVLDQLSRRDEFPGRFAGRLDLERIGLFGHSFGGAIALEVCRIDSRCKAGANLDGYPYVHAEGPAAVKPSMFLWSEPLSAADPAWRQAVRDARRLTRQTPHGGYHLWIKGTRHLSFADRAVSGGIGTIDARRGLHVAAAYVRMFFDRHLLGREASALEGNASEYPEVSALELDGGARPAHGR
jgi:dienelactone hydrolase